MTRAQSPGTAVCIARSFDAPVERVWDAWVSADDLRRWAWGSLSNDVTAVADARAGGRYRIETARPDGDRWAFEGEYLEVDRPNRLVYTVEWSAPMGYASPGERVTVAFSPDGERTAVDFSHEGIPAGEAAETHRKGWENTFDALAALLAAGG